MNDIESELAGQDVEKFLKLYAKQQKKKPLAPATFIPPAPTPIPPLAWAGPTGWIMPLLLIGGGILLVWWMTR